MWEIEEDLPRTKKLYDPQATTFQVTVRYTLIQGVAVPWLTKMMFKWAMTSAINETEEPLLMVGSMASKLLLPEHHP